MASAAIREPLSSPKMTTASGRAEHAAPRRDGAGLRQFPRDFSGLNIDRAKDALRGFVWRLHERAAHVAAPSGPLHRNFREDAALVVGLHVVEAGGRIERCRVPVRRPFERRTDAPAFERRLHVGHGESACPSAVSPLAHVTFLMYFVPKRNFPSVRSST